MPNPTHRYLGAALLAAAFAACSAPTPTEPAAGQRGQFQITEVEEGQPAGETTASAAADTTTTERGGLGYGSGH
jgi:hypothetical protein